MSEVKMTDPVADQLREKYPPNSLASKTQPKQEPPREKLKPVVQGATVQKKTFGEKVKGWFIPADVKDIREYAINQIIVPGLKNGILALIEMAFFNEVRRRPGPQGNNRTNYSYVSTSTTQVARGPTMSQRDRNTHNFQNITFKTYQDAEDVISTLLDCLDRYGSVSVADLYDAAGLDSNWADGDWGWTSFQKLESRAVRGGYIIDVQPPIYLKGR